MIQKPPTGDFPTENYIRDRIAHYQCQLDAMEKKQRKGLDEHGAFLAWETQVKFWRKRLARMQTEPPAR